MKPRLSPGKWLLSLGVFRKCKIDSSFDTFVSSSVKRYVMCDWGEIPLSDSAANDNALVSGTGHISARYYSPLDGYDIYITTAFAQGTTTISLPDEL